MEKKKILIIDDEADFTRLMKLNLEETGKYEVSIENKGANGFATVKSFKPDLILLDILIPDMYGTEIARQIRSDESVKNIPIVFLTALIREKEIGSQGAVIKGYPFLAKPVSTEDLIRCIEKNIRG